MKPDDTRLEQEAIRLQVSEVPVRPLGEQLLASLARAGWPIALLVGATVVSLLGLGGTFWTFLRDSAAIVLAFCAVALILIVAVAYQQWRVDKDFARQELEFREQLILTLLSSEALRPELSGRGRGSLITDIAHAVEKLASVRSPRQADRTGED